MIRRWVFTWVALVAFVLSGCSGETLPTYDAARAEAEAAMQRVVDQLPADSRVVDTTDLTPYACSDGGGVLHRALACDALDRLRHCPVR